MGPLPGPSHQQEVQALSPQTTPVAWASAQPKGRLPNGHSASNLTGASLKPQVRSHPQFLGQKHANLGGLGSNWAGAKGSLEGSQAKGSTGSKLQAPDEEPELILEDLGSSTPIGEGVHHTDQGPSLNPQQDELETHQTESGQQTPLNTGGHEEPQAEIRLRDTSGDPYDHVDQSDVDSARRDIDASVQRADQEELGKKDSMSMKDKLKALWKTDLVKGIVFAAVATLALVAIVGLAAAIPFTGGGSALALAGLLFVVCLVFQAAVVGSVVSFASAGQGDPNLAGFGGTYQKLQEEMKEKEADPTYKPSFADFYANPDVKSVVDGKDKNYELQQEARPRMSGLKELQAKLTQFEAQIKEREQERDALERVGKRKIDENNVKLTDLKQQVAERAALETELQECQQQLDAQYDAINPQDVDLRLIDRLNERIGSLEQKLVSSAQSNQDNLAEIGKLESANANLTLEIDTMKGEYNGKIAPMKQQAKQDKDAIDTQFKQFLKDFDSLDKLITQKTPEGQQSPSPQQTPPQTTT
ncbi:hypothetical protein [Estrella lausannensis]|uniref:hypothetical protein n=1 Tax=Estrella lausannensis TaxID=483423 RepID=UPI000BF0880A|nr:hypothetical protein [Estrella lausannensis]